jgi:hypothetical protein
MGIKPGMLQHLLNLAANKGRSRKFSKGSYKNFEVGRDDIYSAI